ncbi:MAG: YybS family protein [Desulfuromonadaceae bacterium]|nr:YybS family protein [Desulfuromonadaceae bacterium]MDD5107643.1 YybS family protein [Desulfuromonadaceae bacterium]
MDSSASSAGPALRDRLKASLLGVVSSFVLFAAYLAVPPIGIFSGILAPFPASYNRLLHGRMSALIVLLGAATATTALFGIIAGALYLGICGIIGFVMPEFLLRGTSGSRALLWTTAANLLLFVLAFVAYSTVSGTNLPQLVTAEISDSMNQAVAIYEKAGVTGEDLDILKSSMATGASLISRLYPALVTALLVGIAGCNLALIKKTSARFSLLEPIDDFSTFRTPDRLVWVLIAAGFALLLPSSILTTPALNILMITLLLYFIQGMSVVSAVISRNSISAFVRVILYALLIIQPYLLALVAGVGLFDLWVDFRTPKTQENL